MSAGPGASRFRRALRIAGLLLGTAVVCFAVGYLLAERVLFPSEQPTAVGVPVPDLVGSTPDAARRVLSQLGLELGEETALVQASVARGIVLAQSPVPGQRLHPGAAVHVGVSAGRAMAPVPDVVGLPESAATALLARLGFHASARTEPDFVLPGEVIRTVPAAGERLLLPATIEVYVSAGPPQPDTLAAGGDSAAGPQ